MIVPLVWSVKKRMLTILSIDKQYVQSKWKIPYKKLKFNMKYLPSYAWGTFEQPLLCPKVHDALMNSDPLLLTQGRKKVMYCTNPSDRCSQCSNYFDVIKNTTLTLRNFAAPFNLIHFSSSLLRRHIITHINSYHRLYRYTFKYSRLVTIAQSRSRSTLHGQTLFCTIHNGSRYKHRN